MRDVTYKSISCGPAGSFQPGDTRYGVDDTEANELVKGGFAEYADASPRTREQAVVVPAERAVSPAQPVIPQPQPVRSNTPRRGGR